jgi:hypothetical protein
MYPEAWISITLAALIAALILIIEHYAPWFRHIANGKLHPVANYILGCLALFVPYTLLVMYWSERHVNIIPLLALVSLWVIAGTGGLAVILCYAFDRYVERGQRLREAEERENHLRQTITKG